MTLASANSLLNQWGPWFAVLGFVWRVYVKTKKGAATWMGKLLDNHLHHVQLSLDASLVLQREQIALLKKIAGKN